MTTKDRKLRLIVRK